VITRGQKILISILVPLAIISGTVAIYRAYRRHKEIQEAEQGRKDIEETLARRPKLTPPGGTQNAETEVEPSAEEEYPRFYSDRKVADLKPAERAKLAGEMLDFLARADNTPEQRDRAYRTLLNCREAAAVLLYNALNSDDMRKQYYMLKACTDLRDLYFMDVSEGRSFAEAARKVPADVPPDVRTQLARLLGCYRDALSLSRLDKLADDEDPGVKYAALVSLARVGNAASVPIVAAALDSGDPAIQAAACRAMNAIIAYDVGTEFISAPDYKDALQREVAKWRKWWRDNKAAYE
jgi:hypothetical protein